MCKLDKSLVLGVAGCQGGPKAVAVGLTLGYDPQVKWMRVRV